MLLLRRRRRRSLLLRSTAADGNLDAGHHLAARVGSGRRWRRCHVTGDVSSGLLARDDAAIAQLLEVHMLLRQPAPAAQRGGGARSCHLKRLVSSLGSGGGGGAARPDAACGAAHGGEHNNACGGKTRQPRMQLEQTQC